MENKKLILQIVDDIKTAAALHDVHPSQVTRLQFRSVSDVSEWKLRTAGGLTEIKRLHYPETERDLATVRYSKEVATYIRKLERNLSEKELFQERITLDVLAAVDAIGITPLKVDKPTSTKDRKMTMELMLSDIHYGLKSNTFNLKVCRARVQHLTAVFLNEVIKEQCHYNVERIIIAIIGDIIQSYTMHGLESAASSEFGNSEQIQVAIESLFNDVIAPIAQTGIKIDIPAVTGNHDRTEKGRTYNYPGKTNVTWVIYKALEALCEASKLSNVTFYIPEGSYQTLDIYGSVALYEHLDNAKACTKQAFEELMRKRSRQVNKVVHFLRGGHWHEYQCYDRGRIIVNESVCGEESYGETLGFLSSAGQTINYYIETDRRPTPFYKSFPVYLGHIGADAA
jgi:hypothetical protein